MTAGLNYPHMPNKFRRQRQELKYATLQQLSRLQAWLACVSRPFRHLLPVCCGPLDPAALYRTQDAAARQAAGGRLAEPAGCAGPADLVGAAAGGQGAGCMARPSGQVRSPALLSPSSAWDTLCWRLKGYLQVL